ncbi:MAG: hypothetical protein ACM3OA_10855 [Acidobacteriota bacterium]
MKPPWRRLPRGSRRAAAIGLVALLACAVGGWFDPRAFFQGWLIAWLFVLGTALAAMMNVMIHELTGGEWGLVLRPPLEAAMLTLPFCALLALPLAFGLPELFAWARPADVAASAALQHRQWFLNVPSFLVRNGVWLLAWSILAVALGLRLGHRGPADLRLRRRLSVTGLLVYLVTVTVFAYDWIVSLVPEWSSTAVGVRLGAGEFLGAFAFGVVFATLARKRTGLVPTPRDNQDFGNLLLTFAMFWGYIAFTQFLIVWGEDIPRETSWYGPRVQTSWHWLGLAVLALELVVPFLAMLFRSVKRDASALATVCALVLAGQWLDTLWLTAPSLRHAGFAIHWLDLVALVAQGGVWLALVAAIVEWLPPARAIVKDTEAGAHA